MNVEHLIGEIKRMKVSDEDIIVVRTTYPLTQQQGEHVRQTIQGVLKQAGRSSPVMVIDRTIKLEVLSAPKFKSMTMKQLVAPREAHNGNQSD